MDYNIYSRSCSLAHIFEYPDYYIRLKNMEQQAEKYWKNKKKPLVLKK